MEITMQTNSGAELDCPSPDEREDAANEELDGII